MSRRKKYQRQISYYNLEYGFKPIKQLSVHEYLTRVKKGAAQILNTKDNIRQKVRNERPGKFFQLNLNMIQNLFWHFRDHFVAKTFLFDNDLNVYKNKFLFS